MTPIDKGSNHENPEYILIITTLILIIKTTIIIIIIFNVMGGPMYIPIYRIYFRNLYTSGYKRRKSVCSRNHRKGGTILQGKATCLLLNRNSKKNRGKPIARDDTEKLTTCL